MWQPRAISFGSPSATWGEVVRVLFAHGFEGSPEGSKVVYMRDALGWDVTAPEMSELGWSIASQTEVLIRHLDEGQYDLVAGSSMGGLAAANASSMRPEADIRLLLIAPSFGLAENWEGMEEAGRSAWKLTGERRYAGFELDILLPWEFMESAEKMSWPETAHPTAIMHGTNDEVVPISYSRKVAEKCANVNLHEVDDNHRMKESLRLIPDIVTGLMGSAGDEGAVLLEKFQNRLDEDGEKLEVPKQSSTEVSDVEEQGVQVTGDFDDDHELESEAANKSEEAEREIQDIQAEMKRLEAEMAQKQEVLEASKEEERTEQEARDRSEAEAEEARLEAEAKAEAAKARKKAEAEVIAAKVEAEEARMNAEIEEAEAEEARMNAEIEEAEAEEAKAEAEAAEKRVDEAVRKAEEAGKDIELIASEAEREEREELILERVGLRSEQINWAQVGKSENGESDDLTRINGVDDFTQKKLNVLGIHSFGQISKMGPETSEIVNDALEFMPGRINDMEWMQQAMTLIGLEEVGDGSQTVETGGEDSDRVGLNEINWTQIGRAKNEGPDDLTKIQGIDDLIQKKLNVIGIHTFEQISRMDKVTAEAVNGALEMMPGRVAKMMWAQQAMTLIG